ncbi:GNAT family N-acetyltransferase [Sporolactobacillus vineae]|uniref:GNAT family N-acetyltransferase n=1 Tax=Sporolactobacillus vineae TaxID=444463 RepID=UPI0002887D7F|nr:GNAT family N-acetyltransferase [Sporolactobacillus vineae]
MIIKKYARLNSETTEELRKLENVCRTYNRIQSEPVYLDISLHYDKRICHTFIAYESGQAVSFVHLFLPTAREAELTAMTHPDYRGQGYFTALLFSVEEELNKYRIPDLLFVSDHVQSAQNESMLEHLDATYDFSEYVMTVQRQEWNNSTTDNGLILEKAEYKDLDDLTALSVAAFNDSPEDARRLAEKALLSGSREGFKAVFKGKVVGMLSIDYEEKDPGIFGFAIHPEYQKKGFGRRLMSLILIHLFERGALCVKLEVDSKNAHALHLYQKIGFKAVSGYDYYRKPLNKHVIGQEIE